MAMLSLEDLTWIRTQSGNDFMAIDFVRMRNWAWPDAVAYFESRGEVEPALEPLPDPDEAQQPEPMMINGTPFYFDDNDFDNEGGGDDNGYAGGGDEGGGGNGGNGGSAGNGGQGGGNGGGGGPVLNGDFHLHVNAGGPNLPKVFIAQGLAVGLAVAAAWVLSARNPSGPRPSFSDTKEASKLAMNFASQLLRKI